MTVRNRTADLLYQQMLVTTPVNVARTSAKIVNAIQQEPTADQMLGIAAALICMLNKYDLNHVDVLGMADNYVYDGNMRPEFKAIKQFMGDEWWI